MAAVPAAGSADPERSERPALGLGAQTATTEAGRTGLGERPLRRRGDRKPAPPAAASDAPASGALLSLASGREPHPGLAPHYRAFI